MMCDKSALRAAFLQGAKFWEFHSTGGTMWQSDQRLCAVRAKEMEEDGTLGVDRLIANESAADCKGEG